jgi:glyoxylase-like metal-dependent hydrolase (beta-lactamase superfamily II)
MPRNNYHLKLGQFECIVVDDGQITVPNPDDPATMSQTTLSQTNPGQRNKLDIMCMLVKTPEHQILIDTGCGDGFGPESGKLMQNLLTDNIRPSDIDTVIFSHGDSDHIAGNLDRAGNLAFPKARYLILKTEWDYWVGSLESTIENPNRNPGMLEFARLSLLPLRSRIELIQDETEIYPGIKIEKVPGHTPGNGIITLSSQGQKLVYIGDLIHHPIELQRPDYYAMFDQFPAIAVRNRNKVLRDVSRAGTMVFSPHFPFPGLGQMVSRQKTFEWKSI